MMVLPPGDGGGVEADQLGIAPVGEGFGDVDGIGLDEAGPRVAVVGFVQQGPEGRDTLVRRAVALQGFSGIFQSFLLLVEYSAMK